MYDFISVCSCDLSFQQLFGVETEWHEKMKVKDDELKAVHDMFTAYKAEKTASETTIEKYFKSKVAALQTKIKSAGKKEHVVTRLRNEIRILKATGSVNHNQEMRSQMDQLLANEQSLISENSVLETKVTDLEDTIAVLKVNQTSISHQRKFSLTPIPQANTPP